MEPAAPALSASADRKMEAAMLYALIVVACLAGNPDICTQQVTMLPDVSNVSACHLVGRMELEKWMQENPNMKLSDAYCAVAVTQDVETEENAALVK